MKKRDVLKYLFGYDGYIPTVKKVLAIESDKVCVILMYNIPGMRIARKEFIDNVREGLFKMYHAGEEFLDRSKGIAIGIDLNSIDAYTA